MKNWFGKKLLMLGSLCLVLSATLTLACTQASSGEEQVKLEGAQSSKTEAITYVDRRNYQHGIDLIKPASGNYYLVWSSSGNPPTGAVDANGDWIMDIYYSVINPVNPVITPVVWLNPAMAQEPVSTAINSAGKICSTWEEALNMKNEVGQLFMTSTLPPIGNYSASKVILDGGHSGHVATVGETFVVHWSEGWTGDGKDGVDLLGSGNGCYVNAVSSAGALGTKYTVASGRNWWPEVDGSPTKACLIWQTFVTGQQYADLKMRIFDPVTGTLGATVILMNKLLYYHYSVRYIAAIDRFLVMASKDGGAGANNGRLCAGGKAFLIDNSGNITASLDMTNGVIRESQTVVNGTTVAQTFIKNGKSVFGNNSSGGVVGGITVLTLTASSITLAQTIDDTYEWFYIGNDGYFQNNTTLKIFTLSMTGIITKTYTINPVGQ